MKVFKFGGASVKSSSAVKNVAEIISQYKNSKLLVVLSAMGKMTNLLEEFIDCSLEERPVLLKKYKTFHSEIAEELGIAEAFTEELNKLVAELEECHVKHKGNTFALYDDVVSKGELCSTILVTAYLKHLNFNVLWIDARDYIKTSNSHKNSTVDWVSTEKSQHKLSGLLENREILITQGFIGSNANGHTTTLGREGSDFSGAIFSYILEAEELTIWKDVDGMLNADPKIFKNTIKLDSISYHEAIELAYYGASVIHPKTVKPLQNKNIPLYVKSFITPDKPGTVIGKGKDTVPLVPSYISKHNQLLISFIPLDFSFVEEKHLAEIFELFSLNKVSVNLMQNSAVSFTVVVDEVKVNLEILINSLKSQFQIRYNSDLELITIRHYTDEIINELTSAKEILLQQKSRKTTRLVLQKS